MATRLNGIAVAANRPSLSDERMSGLVARAVELGETSDDDDCRALLAELLKLQAHVMVDDDPVAARTLLTRVVEDFADVDDPDDSAEDRLEDPHFRGRELLARGDREAAAAALQEAADGGDRSAWLGLGLTLAHLSGRERDEERALREALDAEVDPERRAMAGYLLGCLLRYGRGDRPARAKRSAVR